MLPDEHEVPPLVSETVRVLAAAWRAAGAYPDGHPRRRATLELAHQRLDALTRASGELVLGIGPDGLLVGSASLRALAAERLARALHEREVAVLRLAPGATLPELERLLGLLATPPAQGAGAPPPWELLTPATTPHIRAIPIDYSRVRVTDELRQAPAEGPEAEALSTRIVRALMVSDRPWSGAVSAPGPAGAAGTGSAPEGSAPPPALSISEAATLIVEALREAGGGAGPRMPPGAAGATPDGSAAGPAPELALTSRLAATVEAHLADTAGPARAIAARQATELVLALPAPIRDVVLQATLRVLAGSEGTPEDLQTCLSAVTPDEVTRALRALQAEGAVLSRHALLLLRSLSGTGSPGDRPAPDPAAGAALRSELLQLFRFEDVDRYNPEDHQALLDQAGIELPVRTPVTPAASAELEGRSESLADDALACQLALSLLDVAEHHPERAGLRGILARLEETYRALLARGRLEPAIDAVEALQALAARPEGSRAARDAVRDCLDRLGSVELLAELVTAQGVESVGPAARRLLERLGGHAVGNLLVVLTEEPNRSRRRHAFDLLVAMGSLVVPPARDLLADRRWYVVRNMIALLRAVGDRTSLPEIQRFADAGEPRVRVEALRTLLAFQVPDGRALLARAFSDTNPKTAEAAIALAGQHGTPDLVEPLLEVLGGLDLRGRRRSVRVEALRALGRIGAPAALSRLARFLRVGVLPLASLEERRAAFRALEGFPEAARRPWVARGLGARDAEIRAVCQRLSGPTA